MSERPIALQPTLSWRWEWLRAPPVQEWKRRSRVKGDATEGSNACAQRAAWEALLNMETYDNNVEAMDQGATTLG